MKKLLKVALVAGCMLMAGNFAKAQTKLGYIRFNDLIEAMPETKTVQTQLQAYQKQFMDQLNALNTEYTSKLQAYQSGRASMTDAIRTAKETELGDIQKRMQDYQNTAQQQVTDKGNELFKPVTEKARTAINAVAKEKGYTYVIDTTQVELIVAPTGDDLLAAVKAKLGLPATAAPAGK
ncbi:OmpH family outer membrane protein [Mucilaginibacter sp. KACC 22063]|uniref:OmpH family outer membrane protein n=1 Tax=Mucilaginibacter sp. KACC 22063 TaxID=3025666 RepID=UPI0023673854|nr:OmpH family outer membrane protein [Mucilaginibacter sp. KACC 22063]WDF56834.1 OmpH family outer membrane protein [Mucilaginibacter sp. KACC 22063]